MIRTAMSAFLQQTASTSAATTELAKLDQAMNDEGRATGAAMAKI